MGPLDTKGAGEVTILNVGAVVACAVANAIGKPVHSLPLTPPRVLKLILEDSPLWTWAISLGVGRTTPFAERASRQAACHVSP